MERWDSQDVAVWLGSLGPTYRSLYANKFIWDGVTGKQLLRSDFREATLVKLGVKNKAHQRRFFVQLALVKKMTGRKHRPAAVANTTTFVAIAVKNATAAMASKGANVASSRNATSGKNSGRNSGSARVREEENKSIVIVKNTTRPVAGALIRNKTVKAPLAKGVLSGGGVSGVNVTGVSGGNATTARTRKEVNNTLAGDSSNASSNAPSAISLRHHVGTVNNTVAGTANSTPGTVGSNRSDSTINRSNASGALSDVRSAVARDPSIAVTVASRNKTAASGTILGTKNRTADTNGTVAINTVEAAAAATGAAASTAVNTIVANTSTIPAAKKGSTSTHGAGASASFSATTAVGVFPTNTSSSVLEGVAAANGHANATTTATSNTTSALMNATAAVSNATFASNVTSASNATSASSITSASNATSAASGNGSNATAAASGKGSNATATVSSKGSNATAVASSKGSNATAAVNGKGSNATAAVSGNGSNATAAANGKGSNATAAANGKGSKATAAVSGKGSNATAAVLQAVNSSSAGVSSLKKRGTINQGKGKGRGGGKGKGKGSTNDATKGKGVKSTAVNNSNGKDGNAGASNSKDDSNTGAGNSKDSAVVLTMKATPHGRLRRRGARGKGRGRGRTVRQRSKPYRRRLDGEEVKLGVGASRMGGRGWRGAEEGGSTASTVSELLSGKHAGAAGVNYWLNYDALGGGAGAGRAMGGGRTKAEGTWKALGWEMLAAGGAWMLLAAVGCWLMHVLGGGVLGRVHDFPDANAGKNLYEPPEAT
jgi:hypothetical protein